MMEQFASFLASVLTPVSVIVSMFFVYVGILVLRNYQQWQECEYSYAEDDKPKIKIDPAKALAARVKFVMRLKRKMKEFKEKKTEEEKRKANIILS